MCVYIRLSYLLSIYISLSHTCKYQWGCLTVSLCGPGTQFLFRQLQQLHLQRSRLRSLWLQQRQYAGWVACLPGKIINIPKVLYYMENSHLVRWVSHDIDGDCP